MKQSTFEVTPVRVYRIISSPRTPQSRHGLLPRCADLLRPTIRNHLPISLKATAYADVSVTIRSHNSHNIFRTTRTAAGNTMWDATQFYTTLPELCITNTLILITQVRRPQWFLPYVTTNTEIHFVHGPITLVTMYAGFKTDHCGKYVLQRTRSDPHTLLPEWPSCLCIYCKIKCLQPALSPSRYF
jgi:hypothetical protein